MSEKKAPLKRYRAVACGTRLPARLRTARRQLGHVSLESLSTQELWALHDRTPAPSRVSSGPSRLDLKIELARRILGKCTLCERRCGVDRLSGKLGFCGVGNNSYYFFEQILHAEEEPVIPSHEVFFSGCNMRCKFCYSWESLIDTSFGTRVVPDQFARLLDRRRSEGAANVNLIGGEPTVHLHSILESLKLMESRTAVIWNSNFLMSPETMKLLDEVVDLYLGDFHFGNDRCAAEVGGTQGYLETVTSNFRMAACSSDVIVRHLLLPGHLECCLLPVARWMSENLPEVPFHLMFQYTPFHWALEDEELCRCVSKEEEEAALEIVSSLNLNTRKWNRPLPRVRTRAGAGHASVRSGSEEFRTSITIGADGTVSIMHLHEELLGVVGSIRDGGQNKDG